MRDDTISRQAAIAWCRPEDWGTPDERWRPESEYGAMIGALPPAQQWIPVAERMPEQRDLVLIMYYTNKGRHFYGVDFYNGVGFITENVTHWMPLPDPPKGEDDERTD